MHIGWTKSTGPDTEWSQPEPDNYNRAILDTKGHHCEFIGDQVIYYDQYRQGWIGVYYVPDTQHAQFDAWATALKPNALWRCRGIKFRNRRGLIWNRKGTPILTDNERLYLLGYYDYLAKYFCRGDIRLRLPVGEARAELMDLLKESADVDQDDPDINDFG